MAIINVTGFESGVVGEALSTTGTVSFGTGVPHTGTYNLLANPTTTAVGWTNWGSPSESFGGLQQAFDKADIWANFYFRIATLPAADSEPICQVITGAAALKLEIRVDSAGNLSAYDAAVGLLATGATVLSTDTYYSIGIRCGTSATVGAYEVTINGVSEFSGTGNTSATNAAGVGLGKTTNRNGRTVAFQYDDLIISDSGYNEGAVVSKIGVPTANGSTMSWTSGTGASDYTQVDEVPPNVADYVMSPTTGNPNLALFAMQDCATIDTNIATGTILGVMFYTMVREDTTVTSSVNIRILSGSTSSEATTPRNSTTTASFNRRFLALNPDTSTAWTTTTIDAVETGAIENNAVAQRGVEVYMMVVYIPGGDEATVWYAALV